MRALLLAAGFGTRLRPLTETLPKCLVPIKGQPLLGIWLERLHRANIGPLLINTHYLPQEVESFVSASPYRSEITLAYEAELRGTAGTLIHNLDFFDGGDAMLIHADNYCLADLPAFVESHHKRPAGCLMTMMTFTATKPEACGIVEVDSRGVVKAFHEKVANPPGNVANGAVYVLSPELLHILGSAFQIVRDFSTQVIPGLVGKVYTHHTSGLFMDIGTPENYAAANQL